MNTEGAPSSITLGGSNTLTASSINTDYTTTAAGSGLVSFDWDYSSEDLPGYDGFGYLLNGFFTELTDFSPSSDSTIFSVGTGDVFGFRVFAIDDLNDRGTATISNFSAPAPAAPVPGPLPLLGVGAAFGYSRRLRRRINLSTGPLSTASQLSDRV